MILTPRATIYEVKRKAEILSLPTNTEYAFSCSAVFIALISKLYRNKKYKVITLWMIKH